MNNDLSEVLLILQEIVMPGAAWYYVHEFLIGISQNSHKYILRTLSNIFAKAFSQK